MAMTKAERELMAQLRRELDLHRVYVGHALDVIPPDLPAPMSGEQTSGWDFRGACSYDHGRVYRAWSTSFLHGEGAQRDPNRSGTKGGRALYSTRERALAALLVAQRRVAADELLRAESERIPQGGGE